MIALALILQAATTPLPVVKVPTAEQAELGRQVAASGTFGRLAPLMVRQQTDEMVRDTPGLTLAEKAQLGTIAASTGKATIDRIIGMMGVAYAEGLSADDMRAIIAFNRTGAAQRYRAAEPNAMAIAVRTMGTLDFKRDVMKAFCAKTGKGCPPTK
ncbi:DUF2059 domain-containing protein [Sphingomonas sp. RS2018]